MLTDLQPAIFRILVFQWVGKPSEPVRFGAPGISLERVGEIIGSRRGPLV